MPWVQVEPGNICLLWLVGTYPHSAACGRVGSTGEHQVVACEIGTRTQVGSNQLWLSTSMFSVAGPWWAVRGCRHW